MSALGTKDASGSRRRWRLPAVFAIYLCVSVAATWPLPRHLSSRLAGDLGDPLLNASILVWNATTVPFSPAWWNAPHYYPSEGVSAFTENLVGLSPFASPVYWLTGNPILGYNVALFLTWPLSAFSVYLLVRFLSGREDAAFLAGLSFGFTPYRAAGLSHIQTLAAFGTPLFLLGLHRFLEERRWPWLLLFGAAWLQQALANGYFILYGGLLIGLWLVYFCSNRRGWPAGAPIIAVWAAASVPLVPILLKYRQIHEHLGLHRTLNEILAFSATPASWFEVSEHVWAWRALLPNGKDNLFPGAAAAALVIAGTTTLLFRRRSDATAFRSGRPSVRIALGAATALSVAAILVSLRYGQVDTTIAGIPVRIRNLNRALAGVLLFGVPLLLMTPRTRDALSRRSALVFYAAATIVIALLCFGPVLRVGDDVVLSPAPYGWLMNLPGFYELRVPTQLRMLVVLCLAIAAGLAFARLAPLGKRASTAVFSIAALGLMVDGWIPGAPMAVPPPLRSEIGGRERTAPLLELPIGVDWDAPATFRAAVHHRRVLNGYSGYDPPHYVALRAGLDARDPAMLGAIASLGAFDIAVDRSGDRDGTLARYASTAPGAVRVEEDESLTVFHVPGAPEEPPLGAPLPIAAVQAVRHEGDWRLMHDGRIETGWGDYPQKPDEWIVIDLGLVRTVGGVTNNIGEYVLDFPRRLAIELSTDAQVWNRVWEGPAAARAFLGFVRDPRSAALRFAFDARPARFVRLVQLETYPSMWRVSELLVHAPAS